MLPDPPGANQSALRLCKSILTMLWDLTDRLVEFWSSWDLCADLRETSREAETAAQHSGRLGAVFPQQWFLHYHKAFRLCYSHKICYIIIWHALFKSFYIYTNGQSGRKWYSTIIGGAHATRPLRELRDAPLGGRCGETMELERREPTINILPHSRDIQKELMRMSSSS